MAFLEALDCAYGAAPGQVLPNALWKTRRALVQGGFTCTVDWEEGVVSRLAARDASMLSVFWTRDRTVRVPETLLKDVGLALLHADYASEAVRSSFSHSERYFRLSRDGAAIPQPWLPAGFGFAPVALPSAAPAAADLIGRCYVDLRPSSSTIEGWMHHATFSSDLWIWIVDTATRTPVALGIAELDTRIGEGALEWVQVLPDYRGRGLGAALVHELLRRLADRAAFVTVSGQVDNRSQPEALYRRCGFLGHDIWWVLRR
jgi:GNAT superfamily N-acetyltransferase